MNETTALATPAVGTPWRNTGPFGSPPRVDQAELVGAARAARSLGRVGRTTPDHVVLGLWLVSFLVAACGALPALFITLAAWGYARWRSNRLDPAAWAEATPTTGAGYYQALEVAAPEGLAGRYHRYRWWQVVDERGVPTCGRFGVARRSSGAVIIPDHRIGWPPGQPMDIAPCWANHSTRFRRDLMNPGFTVLHLCRETVEPALAVRFSDPVRRDQFEALVYTPR